MRVLDWLYCVLFKICRRDNFVKTILLGLQILILTITLRYILLKTSDVDIIFETRYARFMIIYLAVTTITIGLINNFYFSRSRVEGLLDKKGIKYEDKDLER